MRKVKSIISAFLAVAIAVWSFVPAYAVDPGLIVEGAAIAPSFGDWLVGSGQSLANFFKGFIYDDVCQGAGPTLNNRHVFEVQHTTLDGIPGYYNVCQNCGKAAAVVSKDSYKRGVSELPAQGYNSDGSLLFSPANAHDYMSFFRDKMRVYCSHSSLESSSTNLNYNFSCDDNSFTVFPSDGASYFYMYSATFSYKVVFPADGFYTLLSRPGCSGTPVKSNSPYYCWKAQSRRYYSAGSSGSFAFTYEFDSSSPISVISIRGLAPVFEFEPSTSYVDTYTPDTRPTTITGDYAIVDNQGQVTIVKDSTIVNETTNNYYNPATGEQQAIKDWSYDYPSRTYNVTTDSNNTVTITYGDEHVVINEGDTIYNIYYAMEDDGSGDNPTACEHDWQIGERVAPTCVQPGRQPYTCSKCKEQKADIIPALGHDWQVKQSVTTQYNDSGQLLQEGYTIYECSRCKEQYKTASGVSPPPSGGGGTGSGTDTPGGDGSIWDKLGELIGDTISGISSLLGAVVGKLLDALIALGKMILDGLTVVVGTILAIFDEVPQLFGGFLAFLSAVFPFLPDEMITLLTFGLAAVVFVGIIKAVRR